MDEATTKSNFCFRLEVSRQSKLAQPLFSRDEVTVCVFGTFTLYQFSRDALVTTLKSMQAASASRTIHFISIEGTAYPDAEVKWTAYVDQDRTTSILGRCCAHGSWLEWLA